jgi:phage gp45-like
MNIMNCVRNIFKVGLKTKDVDVQTIEVEYLGKKQDALHYIPYGMFIKPPNTDSFALIFAQEGHEDSLVTMITDIKNRDDELEEGEIFIGIPTNGTRIKIKAGGNIEIYSEGEIILETQAGNKIETTATGLSLEDLNGNTIESNATGWNINSGNHEVLL